MRKSEMILPIRIYDNLFDQNRFNRYCKELCEPVLVYPPNELPFFQFTRQGSLNECTSFYLRNTCDDFIFGRGNRLLQAYYKDVPQGADRFSPVQAEDFFDNYPPTAGAVFDDGINPPSGTTIPIAEFGPNCQALQNLADGPPLNYTYTPSVQSPEFSFSISSSSDKYHFKIIIDKFVLSVGSSFSIKIYNGDSSTGTLIGTITGAGEYNYYYTSTSNTMTVVLSNLRVFDQFAISYLQAEYMPFYTPGSASIELDTSAIKISPTILNTDIITYCEGAQNYNVPPGDYYYVVVCGDELYFSEVFKIKSIFELQEYYRVKWYNSCDINDAVIYNPSVLGCNFYNVLYLDAALFSPEFETEEETEENGLGDRNSVFKRWQKNISLDILKSPPFITDALSGIFLHDNIYLREPANEYQDEPTEFYKIERVTSEITEMLENCYQSVKLKIVLIERFTNTACCTGASIISCPYPYNYFAVDECSDGDSYQLTLNDPPQAGDGLIACATGDPVEVQPNEIILNTDTGFYYTLELVGGIWQASAIMPSILTVLAGGPGLTNVSGKVLPYNWVTLSYNKNGAGYIAIPTVVQADENGNYTISYPTGLQSGATDFKIKINQKTINCDNGNSDPYDVI